MRTLEKTQILRAGDNRKEDADIVELTADMAQSKIDALWWRAQGLSNVSEPEADSHWNWQSIVLQHNNNILSLCLAVLSQENYLEGAIALRFDSRSQLEAGEGSVYIDRLATAPRNRSGFASTPIYKGVGSALMYKAVKESYMAGLGGRISLQSLPALNTIRFYENKGFIRTDLTQSQTGLVDYELPASSAVDWLKQGGDLS